jgi:hypothetical protein
MKRNMNVELHFYHVPSVEVRLAIAYQITFLVARTARHRLRSTDNSSMSYSSPVVRDRDIAIA